MQTNDHPGVINLADHRQPELLGAFEVYRQPDGSISATLLHMNERQIEARETIAERFEAAAEWLRKGAASLDGQAKEFPHDQ